MSTSLVLAQSAQGVQDAKWNDAQLGQADASALRIDSVSILKGTDLSNTKLEGPSLRDPALLLCDDIPDLLFGQSVGDYRDRKSVV